MPMQQRICLLSWQPLPVGKVVGPLLQLREVQGAVALAHQLACLQV